MFFQMVLLPSKPRFLNSSENNLSSLKSLIFGAGQTEEDDDVTEKEPNDEETRELNASSLLSLKSPDSNNF